MSRYPQDRKRATYVKGWHDGIRAFVEANKINCDGLEPLVTPEPPRLDVQKEA